jgi:hypothetical protein
MHIDLVSETFCVRFFLCPFALLFVFVYKLPLEAFFLRLRFQYNELYLNNKIAY